MANAFFVLFVGNSEKSDKRESGSRTEGSVRFKSSGIALHTFIGDKERGFKDVKCVRTVSSSVLLQSL